MGKVNDLTGQRFGRLTVIEQAGLNKSRSMKWKCICDCGNTVVAVGSGIKSGKTKSCGCLHRDRLIEYNKSDSKRSRTSELNKVYKRTHGMRYTRIYKEWRSMINRCETKSWRDYHNYGGRGISVCNEWRESFNAFYEWAISNGYNDSLTLDRLNVNGNYEPSNCRWATNKEQANNKRNSRYLTFNGKTQTLQQWADELGIKSVTLHSRLDKYGWSIDQALTTPVTKRKAAE